MATIAMLMATGFSLATVSVAGLLTVAQGPSEQLHPHPAHPATAIHLGEVPGSQGGWLQGTVTVDASPERVQRWLGEYEQWPARFPDVEWVKVLGTTSDGRSLVRFRSRIAGRTMTLRIADRPGLITYDGEGKNVRTQGRVLVERVGPNRTHVTMQSTSELHGLIGALASEGQKRDRTFRKLKSDLTALTRLAEQQP